jgi:hypothetical protein
MIIRQEVVMHWPNEIDCILTTTAPSSLDQAEVLGFSREDRKLRGFRLGHGPTSVSLIGGCHADEPVGPAMLDRLTSHLADLPQMHPLLTEFTWYLVPHTNPDGEVRNSPWVGDAFASGTTLQGAYLDLASYLRGAVREPPGEDMEFGFPRSQEDVGARPENKAIAAFLRPGAPFALHATFHGMAFAAGPWFLQEHSWADRTLAMREHLRRRVSAMGYRLHDIDRGGDKGFFRIDEGFTSRPDSGAMQAHFLALHDPATADLFRPSSMEFVRSLGGDPLTLVSEMPLFLTPPTFYRPDELIHPPELAELRQLATTAPQQVADRAEQMGVRGMPLVDQMRLQLEFLAAGLSAATA